MYLGKLFNNIRICLSAVLIGSVVFIPGIQNFIIETVLDILGDLKICSIGVVFLIIR